jgi:hypothetical protein
MCVHILTNTTKEQMRLLSERAGYLRLLGMTDSGRQYLNKWKKHSNLPIISRLASYQESDIELDIKAARTYSLGLNKNRSQRLLSFEYTQTPFFISKKEG